MFYYPRFSYEVSETAVPVHVLGMTVVRGTGVAAGYCMPGGYTGWVYRVGIQGPWYYPATLLGEGPTPAKRAPEPCRGGVGGCRAWANLGDGGEVGTHPSDPVGLPAGALPGTSRNAASWPIRARFHDISKKHSQNGQVSPKSVEKASVSPYFQNGPRKSPLGFLGFPFSLAFSHKELMGYI